MKTLFILLLFYYFINEGSFQKKGKGKKSAEEPPEEHSESEEEAVASAEESEGAGEYSDEALATPPVEVTTQTVDPDTEEVITTTEIEIFTEFDIYQYMNITDKDSMTEAELEDLSAATFAALMNKTDDPSDDDDETGVYNANKDYWKLFRMQMIMSMESLFKLHHIGGHEHRLKGCYFIGVTYKNAITDIHNYSKIRYLYTNNLHYEVGFLVQEIIGHYQIAVELYHLMLMKYAKNRHKFFAPTTYMLYIYTNILDQCKTVIHLSNMLHELEEKYRNHPRTIFQDEKGFFKNSSKSSGNMNSYQSHVMQEKKRRMRELKKRRKQLFKSGILTSTQRTMRPLKGPFPLHYGWSIETW